jgi:transcriptional regulator with GAF, ATPase, and Fis domain
LQEAERDNILAALRQSNGRIRGKGGAAELLKVKPTTLEFKIKKLGISRQLHNQAVDASR